ncbi:hypothetical protein GCM10010911_41350 [Paenibacillus nasutitermitis]|uniref:Uncharacterized protein n=1 Tax=Paenibacillus nasutitermitis TaxID=1652958 RepID=A0A917DYK6_9BACL|nr:hypothetical protein GCM10010911_41350 [Paenibacillus nasutitermitis]
MKINSDEFEIEDSQAQRNGMYYIYLYENSGEYGPPVQLDEIQDIFNFCEMNKMSHKEIRVVDPIEDTLVIQVISGKYVFPPQLLRFNN